MLVSKQGFLNLKKGSSFLEIVLIIKDIRYQFIRIQQVEVSVIKTTANATIDWVTNCLEKRMSHARAIGLIT